jgi:hypothetical protein
MHFQSLILANVFFLQLVAFRIFPVSIVETPMLLFTNLLSTLDVLFSYCAFSGIDLALLAQESVLDLILFMNFVALSVVLLAASTFCNEVMKYACFQKEVYPNRLTASDYCLYRVMPSH